jgi:hypothetical protein
MFVKIWHCLDIVKFSAGKMHLYELWWEMGFAGEVGWEVLIP